MGGMFLRNRLIGCVGSASWTGGQATSINDRNEWESVTRDGSHWAVSWDLALEASFSFREGAQCYDEGW